MARAVTLATLRSRVRQLADCVNSTDNPTDAELDGYINDAVAAFWEQVVASGWGRGYFEIEATIAITAGTTTYGLPAAFYSLRLVEWEISASRRIRLAPWQLPEASYLRGGLIWTAGLALTSALYPYYRLRGGGTDGQTAQIELQPAPQQSGAIVLTYVPTPPVLSDVAHSIDGVCGWDRWLVLRAVADLKLKESDPGLAETMALADRELARIRSNAPNRDSGAPLVVVDLY